MPNTIKLETSKLPFAMQREVVAEMIYDWVHESQVTHRRSYSEIPNKTQYQSLATRILNAVKVEDGGNNGNHE